MTIMIKGQPSLTITTKLALYSATGWAGLDMELNGSCNRDAAIP